MRFSLRPHEEEYLSLTEARERILQASAKADVVIISHYHLDHYTPYYRDLQWIQSSPEYARKLYQGKVLLVKDLEHLPPVQRKRGYFLQKQSREVCKEIQVADGQRFKWGKTEIEFSEPLPHGFSAQPLVLGVRVKSPRLRLAFIPDFQGASSDVVRLILRWKPDLLITGGPPLYLSGFRIGKEEISTAMENFLKLAARIPRMVIDHHLFRSEEGLDFLNKISREAKKFGHRVESVAGFLKTDLKLLEARRKELYASKF